MSKLPSLTGNQLIKVLEKIGFDIARVKGSHHILIHADGRRTVVPVHSGEDIGTGLLSQILRDCQIARDELRDLL
ncbi:MAG: type II toxin-antitoxin system HicA family toxin [Pseudanabaena sp.]|jgi:predicted RNA binding protein YcfA (HicA-like mRNA interferase family)|uniref:type II toxin-antitoxin system HicA family toxin n=1 Tax=Microcystis sp. M055S1 TaxID=2771122 RepID=UPI00258785C4|nr:type II toxin-antitoxin system HicA family toxin [Microcystis sp. M055S1]MCA6502960.1 type II toxin-antitoxin system HicA family toxin [Pseudanabaena sp. M090S1SP2A07QC]MCA6507598.1 type II toxin-antitoxin system HicA family toxin [Pseudanabaena sp. M172S2SP2A07QC]MCA6519951.1 type II toxin-antitoxin system HicA family toxin [Pseudanabaena sp. M110S1SP2A07QC]MCA6522731.1 type II toxin-antitoxin system HicA family toxin [Pseudanabaena sp. M051S1SP2A07QC]MCA6526580.1 type II toxin-antitoxin s